MQGAGALLKFLQLKRIVSVFLSKIKHSDYFTGKKLLKKEGGNVMINIHLLTFDLKISIIGAGVRC